MIPRIDNELVNQRREAYKANDWKSYAQLVKKNFFEAIQVSQSGYQALGKTFGLSQQDLQRSVFNHSADLDLREIMEQLLIMTVDPSSQESSIGRDLTRQEVLTCVKERNDNQVEAIKAAQEKRKNIREEEQT